MPTLKELVRDLNPGDEVKGVFKELTNPSNVYDLHVPTGRTYEATGVVYSYPNGFGNGEGLAIRTQHGSPGNGQCLLDPGGNLGGWLVSLEVLKKGDS